MNLQIKQMRKRSGLNQKDVAAAIGVPVRTYGSWERGERNINLEDACLIADVLRCTLDELVGRKPPIITPNENDRQFERLSYCYSMLNDESKEQLAGLASTFTADASRLAFKSREDTETGVGERSA